MSPFNAGSDIQTPYMLGNRYHHWNWDSTGTTPAITFQKKMGNYSELTGLYWIWKNTDSEIVGLSHYRRFFFSKKAKAVMRFKKFAEKLIGLGNKRFGIYYSSFPKDTQLILTSNETIEILDRYDAIIPMGRKMKYSVWEQYNRRHVLKDMEATQQIIAEIYPSHMNAFNEVMRKKELFPCNMFVMKRKCFDEYMEWLFNILFELEKRIDITNYDNYQKRIFGFISERLLDVWLTKQKLKCCSLPILYFKNLKI